MNYEAKDYEITVWWSVRDNAFVGTCAEFPHLSGVGDMREDAVREMQIALECALEIAREKNIALPPPTPQHPAGTLVTGPKSAFPDPLETPDALGPTP